MPNAQLAAERAARKYQIDPKIFKAMIRQESGFNPNAKSGAGAQGIAQFMPSTAKSYGVNLNDGRITDDLEGAAHYLRDNLNRTGGNYHQALSIYNSGKPDAYKDPSFAKGQTFNYVKTILGGAKGESVSGASSTPPAAAPSGRGGTYTTESTKFDQAGFDKAQKLSVLASYLQKRDPNSALLRLGIAKPGAVDPTAFKTTTTQTHTSPGAPSSADGSSSGGAGGGTRPAAQLLEEIYNNGGQGFAVKNGQKVSGTGVYGDVWANHKGHVHLATGPKQVVTLGEIAQSMGLTVSENSHFNGGKRVTSGHAPNSYHYKDQAIDVSGDPAKMAAFAARVQKMYGV